MVSIEQFKQSEQYSSIDDTLDFPELTLKIFQQTASNMIKEVGKDKNELFEALCRRANNFFPVRSLMLCYYSISSILDNNGKLRWPHEVDEFSNPYEYMMLIYGVARELGFQPELYFIKGMQIGEVNQDPNHFKGKIYEHPVLEVAIDKKKPDSKRFIDSMTKTYGLIYKREDKGFRVRNLNAMYLNHAIKFDDYVKLTQPELIAYINYLRTPEGSIETLSRSHYCFCSTAQAEDILSYLVYHEEENVIEHFMNNDRHFSVNRHFKQRFYLDENGDVESTELEIYYTRANLTHGVPQGIRMFCNLPYSFIKDLGKIVPFTTGPKKKNNLMKTYALIEAITEGTYTTEQLEQMGITPEQFDKLHKRAEDIFQHNYSILLPKIIQGNEVVVEESVVLARAIYEARLKKAREQGREYVYSDEERDGFFVKVFDRLAKTQKAEYAAYVESIRGGMKLQEWSSQKSKQNLNRAMQEHQWALDETKYVNIIYTHRRDFYNHYVDLLHSVHRINKEVDNISKASGVESIEVLRALAEKHSATLEQGYRGLFKEQLAWVVYIQPAMELKGMLTKTQKIVKKYLKIKKREAAQQEMMQPVEVYQAKA